MAAPLDLERIYDEHAQALFAFLLNITRSETDTRDLLQELFTKIAQRPMLLKDVGNIRAFLLRLAHNGAIDLARRRTARQKNYTKWAGQNLDLFTPAREPDEQAFREALSEALGALPAEQREVLHLKLWEQFTFEEIAGALDISANTAASRYRYGLDKLRQRLRLLYDEIK